MAAREGALMGWADRIGGGRPQVADWAKARTARLVEADQYLRDNATRLDRDEREAIATWVEQGGRRPWEATDPDSGVRPYPPVEPR